MDNFLKNLGILLIVLGTIVLVLSHFLGWVDYNWVDGTALLLVVAGIIVHSEVYVPQRSDFYLTQKRDEHGFYTK